MDERLELTLDEWEGPLDLLLALARAQKVDLRRISVLQLVEQYLEVVARAAALRLEVAADWLVMAAWLALLKSALLLPREPDAEPDPDALAAHLQARLAQLAAMREAGARLFAQPRLGIDVRSRGRPEGLAVTRVGRPVADLVDLITAYGQVVARTRPVLHVVAAREVMTLEDALAHVAATIGPAWAPLATMIPAGATPRLRRSALASSTLAALELARQGRAELAQDAPFAPLMVRAA